jgi:hypothetical protein
MVARRHTVFRSLAAALAAGVALIVAAQPAHAGAPAIDDDPYLVAATDHASRAVLVDLRLNPSPTPADYEIATRLFALLGETAPGDADLARLETSAAFGTGDPDLLERATARVVSIDPADTVAQLRLITARIGKKQTVEERLAMYDRLLGPRGTALDPTIRSRLALDAALIHRETGDLDAFLQNLTLATDLDRTNKEAHHLATSYYAGFADNDPQGLAGLLELQLRLMYADPIDPNIHFGIARLLAVEGATAEAQRFYGNGISILTNAGALEARHRVESLALRWLSDGPRIVLNQIDAELRLLRDNARLIYERDKQRDLPDRLLTPPEEAFLDPLYEQIRIIAAMDAQDSEALATGLREIDAYARHQFEEVQEATKLDDQQTRAAANKAFAKSLVSLQFMRVLANVDQQALAAQIPQLPKLIGEDEWEKLKKPLEAWVALRSGNTERTREILEEIGTNDSIMRVCRAELYAAEGDSAGAAEVFEEIMRVDPFIPYGAWARSRAMELTGRTDPVTEAGRLMRRMVAEVPSAIDTLTKDPSVLMTLQIEPVKTSFSADERTRLRVSLTNTTPWPLSLGPSRTLSSRLLLGVSVDNEDRLVAPPQPVVVDLDRRFRLKPGEKLVTEVNAEAGLNGIIFDSAPTGIVRQRWQGWQDPQVDGIGGYRAGPYSLSDSTDKITRSTRDTSRLPAGELATRLRDASAPDAVIAAIEAVAARLWRDGRDPGGLAEALSARYENAGPIERMLLASAIPASAQIPDLAAFDAAVRASLTSEAVRRVETPSAVAALAMLMRVDDPGDPIFAAAAGAEDPVLAKIANLLQNRLQNGRPCFATTGPGARALEGASKVRAIQGGP